jgi:raffinose/stachyose/melibiose transport system substrate-binding protein
MLSGGAQPGIWGWALANLILAIAGGVAAVWLAARRGGRQHRPAEAGRLDEAGAAGIDAAKSGAEEAAVTPDGEQRGARENRQAQGGLWRVLGIAAGVAGIAAFLLTEDMRNPMIIADRWTWLMLGIELIAALSCWMVRRRDKSGGRGPAKTVQPTLLALTLAMMLASAPFLAGCGIVSDGVYFMNFKPEQDAAYQSIAAEYTALTGVPVKVITAANGTYEQRLLNEMGRPGAPTIFQINGPVSYNRMKPYTADLSQTELYSHLPDKSMAITDGAAVAGIPFVIEGYGIIVNKSIMERYFAAGGAKASSLGEINSFARLKEVVEDMQSKREALGIEGVFASTSLMPGQDWRWQTHLANVALHYEWEDAAADLSNPANLENISFKYGECFRQLFDLYLNNSTIPPMMAGFKSVEDSMREFALGQAAMVQNGNWAYGQIMLMGDGSVSADDLALMPLYMGIPGEETQGLCIGTENYFCINKRASKADQQASIDFLNWLFTSDAGKNHVTNNLGFIAPFDNFSEADKPRDPLGRQVMEWSARTGVLNVPWNFTLFPSQRFKDDFGANLLLYAQGQRAWADVEARAREDWAAEKSAASR